MNGTLYGVGVGPGDPELLTLKAVRIIRECEIIAAPDSGSGDNLALSIAREYVGDKRVLLLPMPMTRDSSLLAQSRRDAAASICSHLENGENIAFLTLGDPAVYSTYIYIHRLVKAAGHNARMVAGVPSFCAAAAALDRPLCEEGQALHILPASYGGVDEALALDGCKVLMKSGRKLSGALDSLKNSGSLKNAAVARRVGLPGETLVRDLDGWAPGDDNDYFTLILVGEDDL